MSTALDQLNQRVRDRMPYLPIDRKLPRMLDGRVSDDPTFNFGFDDFLPSAVNDSIAGKFRAAIYTGELPVQLSTNTPDWRFFAVFIPSPLLRIRAVYVVQVRDRYDDTVDAGITTRRYDGDLRPFEHIRGAIFELPTNLPNAREIPAILELPDMFFDAWLGSVWQVFADYVVSRVREQLTEY